MARRLRQDDELGPVVPRWCVQFEPGRWGDSDEAYGRWQHAVLDWADANLDRPEHLGPWMDLCRGALWMRTR